MLSHSFQPGPEGLEKATKVLGFRDVPAFASTRQHLVLVVQHPLMWGPQHIWKVWRHGNHEATEMKWTPLPSQMIPIHQCPKCPPNGLKFIPTVPPMIQSLIPVHQSSLSLSP